MRKNKMMRTASGLLVLTLLTTGVISGTFAKYTTEDSAYDVARVAKWGVTLQAAGSLYGENYAEDGEGNTPIVGEDGASVASTQLGNLAVVAPGTQNTSGFSFAINGKPEVKSTVKMTINSANIMLKGGNYGVMVGTDKVTSVNFASFVASGLYISDDTTTFTKVGANDTFKEEKNYYTLEDEVNTEDYYPVVYNLEGKVENATTTGNSMTSVAAAIAEKIDTNASGNVVGNSAKTSYSVDKTYAANTNLSNIGLDAEKITWKWAFTDETSKTGDSASTNDKADTILGNLMAKTVDDSQTSADFDGTVVLAEGDTYKKITVAKETITIDNVSENGKKTFINYFAKDSNDSIVANLSTYFYIDIAVTQVD